MRSKFSVLGIVLLFFIIQFYPCNAQNDSLSKDTLLKKSVAPGQAEKKWKFDSQVDQRNSFVAGPKNTSTTTSLPITGYNIGWVYKDRLRLGFGGYYAKSQGSKAFFIPYSAIIHSNAPKATILAGKNGYRYLVQQNIQMYYITPSIEWIFFRSKWIELSIPVEIGIGYSKLTLSDYFSGADIPIVSPKTGQILKGEDIFFPAMSGLSAMINLTPDVGFQIGGGYRKILQEVGVSPNFDSFYYMVGLQLFPDNIKKNIKADYKAWKQKRRQRKAENK